jgi:hypothetical protein
VKQNRSKPSTSHRLVRIRVAVINPTRGAILQSSHPDTRPAAGRYIMRFITCFSALTGISGCMVGPNYSRPKADVSDTWLDIKTSKQDKVSEDGRWWDAGVMGITRSLRITRDLGGAIRVRFQSGERFLSRFS